MDVLLPIILKPIISSTSHHAYNLARSICPDMIHRFGQLVLNSVGERMPGITTFFNSSAIREIDQNTVEYKGNRYSLNREDFVVSGKKYRKYSMYEGSSDQRVPAKLWQSFSDLKPLRCPDSAGFARFFSYIPILSFKGGAAEIEMAVNALKVRVFRNENRLYTSSDVVKDDSNCILLVRHGNQPVSLSCFQRMVVTAICILNLVRGVLAICQLGFLFIPIDYLPYAFGSKSQKEWTMMVN